jgi:hypothetical protein
MGARAMGAWSDPERRRLSNTIGEEVPRRYFLNGTCVFDGLIVIYASIYVS